MLTDAGESSGFVTWEGFGGILIETSSTHHKTTTALG